jgi:putative DNA primase/helicase
MYRWAEDNRFAVRDARPALPEQLHDRAKDNWDPLLAIASIAGGRWLDLATQAAIAISARDKEDESPDLSIELLHDIKYVFGYWKDVAISTRDLLVHLCQIEESPWSELNRGRPMTPRQLARLLKVYDIHSIDLRFDREHLKGFYRMHFLEAFERYTV